MTCFCKDLPDAFYLDESPPDFKAGLSEQAAGNWKTRFLCPDCNTQWAIDEWDRYTCQIVTRIHNLDGWDGKECEDLQKSLLLKSRGGHGDEMCSMSECGQPRVKDVAWCLDHLYQTGARK